MLSFEMLKESDIVYGLSVAKKLSVIGNDGSPMGFRNAGSTGERKAADFIQSEMKKIGLKDVHADEFDVDAWEFKSSRISLKNQCGEWISYPLSAFAGTRGIDDDELCAEIVDAGNGTQEDCSNLDIMGKIAVIRIDLSEEYWVGVPAYQLELAGAAAVIVVFEGNAFGTDPKALNSADCIARSSIPVLNISRENGKELLETIKNIKTVARLSARFFLDRENGKSRNITGVIPGRHSEQLILLGAHYDGYFHAYQDDAVGIGIIMAVAKAVIDSGYKPENTIVIIAHGSEEFGVCDSHYDWCFGSWNQINKNRKDWQRRIKLFMNIDAVNPDTSDYLVQASSELHGFLENRLSELADRITGLWKDGYAVEDVNGPWSDDYNYFAKGAPVMICGRGRSKWRSMHYHTQFDNYAMEDADLFRAVSEIYLSILLNYDKQLVLCLDFGKTHKAFLQSVDDKLLYACSAEAEEFYRCAEQCMNNAKKLYEYLNRAERSDMARQRRDKAEECCKMMLEVSAFITEKFRALDPEDNVIFVCEQYQKNIAALSSIEEYLLQMDYDGAYDSIGDLFGASTALKFSEQVYRYWCLDAFDGSRRELYWGSNLAEQPLDVALLYKMVSEAGRSDVEHEQACMSIERLRRKETEKYEYVIRDKEDDLRELAARFDEITDYIEESFF